MDTFDLTPYNAYVFYENETGIDIPIWFGSDESETIPLIKISEHNDYEHAYEIDLNNFKNTPINSKFAKIYEWISINYSILIDFFKAYINGGEHPVTRQDMYEMEFISL